MDEFGAHKNKLVVWSGGLDSTVLLTEVANSFGTKQNPVLAVSIIQDDINRDKMQMEAQARNNYLDWAHKQQYKIEHHTITISSTIHAHVGGWTQARMWLCAITPYISSECDVLFGYIQGDCVWPGIQHIYGAHYNLSALGEDSTTNLVYPYMYIKKQDIIRKRVEYKIPDNCTWTCETPTPFAHTFLACRECEPCKALDVATYAYKKQYATSKKEKRAK